MNNSPWLDRYDKGVPLTIEVPEAPLYCFLEEAAQKYPDGACTIFKGAVISFREMNALADRMAAALSESGYTCVCCADGQAVTTTRLSSESISKVALPGICWSRPLAMC